ncbi:hypothetical protein Ancab_013947, partial [Ancistrocladus abbreviatus]
MEWRDTQNGIIGEVRTASCRKSNATAVTPLAAVCRRRKTQIMDSLQSSMATVSHH